MTKRGDLGRPYEGFAAEELTGTALLALLWRLVGRTGVVVGLGRIGEGAHPLVNRKSRLGLRS